MPTHQPSTAPLRLPDESPQGARIKVVGVGGGGSNAIDRMIDFGVEGVEFIALNTDVQALEVSKAPVRGQLGSLLTHGLSAGSDPNVGRRAAIQDVNEIAEVLEGADMVFITAGLGGGTGTGAAPVIAAIASEMGALTVAIVTRPFNFEGKRRMAIADWGIDHLLRYVDTLIVIPNEKLLTIAKDAPFFESFKIADDFLRQAVQGISDIITTEGVINRDFADVKTTMAGMGYAVMGTASRSGPTRAVDAVMDAMASPLLEEGAIDGARGILINITGSSSLRLSEVNAASRVIQSVAHDDANIIFGAVLDERLGDEVKATVIATGFRSDGRDRSERRARLLRAVAPEATEPEATEPEAATPEPAPPEPLELEPAAPEPTKSEAPVETPTIESTIDQTPPAESHLPYELEAIEVASAETLAFELEATAVDAIEVEAIEVEAAHVESIEPEAAEEEPIEIIAIEEEPADHAETTFKEPGVERLEVEQPDAPQEPIEETVQQEDEHLAIEVYENLELPIDDPPQRYLGVEDDAPVELDANDETHSGLQDHEEDWREAIREIARLAEPAFEVEDDDQANVAQPEHWSRSESLPGRPDAVAFERSPRATDLDSAAQKPASTPPTTRPAITPSSPGPPTHISTTRRAAIAAYAAVSIPEAETETETEEQPTKAINAFAQVLEARRRFVENLAKDSSSLETSTPALAASLETHKLTSISEAQRPEENRRYNEWSVEPESGPQHQARPSRPLTINAEPARTAAPSANDGASREQLNGPSDTPLFKEIPTSQTSETSDPGAGDLPKPPPDFNRRLQREGTEERNGELFESHWNSEIPVPSFGSITERKRYTEDADDLDTPTSLRRGR